MNLTDAPLDVQLSLAPRSSETELRREDTLVEKGGRGEGVADEMVYRPDTQPKVSDYDYALTIDGELKHDISGAKIVESIAREYGDDACLVLHYYINEPDRTVAYSHELYPACDLPE